MTRARTPACARCLFLLSQANERELRGLLEKLAKQLGEDGVGAVLPKVDARGGALRSRIGKGHRWRGNASSSGPPPRRKKSLRRVLPPLD